MLQIKKRKDGALKRRFMPTICFYQDTRHEKPLVWVREILGIGYLSRRNDGMTELRINGYVQVRDILKALMPHIRFKKLQATALCSACEILSNAKRRRLTDKQLLILADLILVIQKENYATKKKRSKNELLEMMGLTP